ncbi:MAG TPA: hypothetical protein VL460_07635 [Caulobacteraceae bacterium]|nr:hypothetical protein [Caulobacteraceae bacterium]
MVKLIWIAVIVAASTLQGASAMSHRPGEAALKAVNQASPQPPETRADARKAGAYLISRRVKLFDANHDGAYTPDEWSEMEFASWALFNKKRDGKILLEEFAQSFNGPTKDQMKLFHEPLSKLKARFDRMDRGHKGYLTIEDFRERAMTTFRFNNVNHDGLVTEGQMKAVATHAR